MGCVRLQDVLITYVYNGAILANMIVRSLATDRRPKSQDSRAHRVLRSQSRAHSSLERKRDRRLCAVFHFFLFISLTPRTAPLHSFSRVSMQSTRSVPVFKFTVPRHTTVSGGYLKLPEKPTSPPLTALISKVPLDQVPVMKNSC